MGNGPILQACKNFVIYTPPGAALAANPPSGAYTRTSRLAPLSITLNF